jgi:hypothetical protein
MPKKIELTGRVFGRLTVIGQCARSDAQGRPRWSCICECGTAVDVRGGDLRQGKQVSCGCYCRERAAESAKNRLTPYGRKKGSPTYKTYRCMIDRCYCKSSDQYHRYGARGITVCERWLESFENFLEDMGKRPLGKTLERIDNDGNYEPDNCVWASPTEQANNKSSNRLLFYRGRTMTVSQWARELNIPVGRVFNRLYKGLYIDDIFDRGDRRRRT